MLRDALGPFSAGQRGWGAALMGIREQRANDPEVRAHQLRKQAKREAAGSS